MIVDINIPVIRRVIFVALLLVLMAASLFFGTDTPLTAYFFSAILMALTGVLLIAGRRSSVPLSMKCALVALGAWGLLDSALGRFSAGLVDYTLMFAAIGVFISAERIGRREPKVDYLWRLLLLAFLLIGFWTFVDFILNPDTIHGRDRPYHQGRLSAAFLSANTAATFFGVAVLAASAPILRALSNAPSWSPILLLDTLFKQATIAVVTFLIATVCLLLTASRAGISFALISLVMLCFWDFIARRQRLETRERSSLIIPMLIGGVSIFLFAILFWSLSGEVASSRYAELDDDTNSRMVMYSSYWAAFLEAPFFGYGFGSFADVNMSAMTQENAHILASQGAAHNFILQWLLQVGLVGCLIVWSIFGAIFRRIMRAFQNRKRYLTYIRCVLIISIFVLLHGMVDYAIEIAGFMWWWALLLGLSTGVASSSHRRKAH